MSFATFEACSRAILRRLPSSPWHHFYRLGSDEVEFDLRDPVYLDHARRKCVFTNGWQFRDNLSLHKHAEPIRRFFRPHSEVLAEVKTCAQEARGKADVLVGVHIRRGDYAAWQGGRYFYDLPQYAAFMSHVADGVRQQGRRAAFLLCSNEVLDTGHFSDLETGFAPGHALKDLYALAQCDLVMGPPSTYSLWAAFYGGARLCHVPDRSHVVALSDFRPLAFTG